MVTTATHDFWHGCQTQPRPYAEGMRRMGSDEWAGLVMLAVAVGVSLPVLLGAVPTDIGRGAWTGILIAFVLCLLLAVIALGPRSRYLALTGAVLSSWALVLAVGASGLVAVILVVVAAVSAYLVPVRVVAGIVVANTVVLWIAHLPVEAFGEPLAMVGFYLLIQIASVLSSLALIREQRMRRDLAHAHVELQTAAVLMEQSARSAERLRISRDLHDLIGHQLTVLTLELEAARHLPGERSREHIDRADSVARDLLADVRHTVSELREAPSDLPAAVHRMVADIPGLNVRLDLEADVRLDEERSAAVLRAVQEIVTNTLRHAEASTLTIQIARHGQEVVLTGVDDGRGADRPTWGNGLRGMAERLTDLGGRLDIDGARGFTVTVRVPAT
ncbi:sensor histidine kinase [Ruania alba]|uniref:Signal transduction histidine kinase n=1 Tax=Ruania alba TaxID=648782 RepID=A0A1H5DIQ5_9MICO|nr:sensor histidine kinase [Ruania alba]SED78717.1 Signal transduction histidine kinase [Ruania alba]